MIFYFFPSKLGLFHPFWCLVQIRKSQKMSLAKEAENLSCIASDNVHFFHPKVSIFFLISPQKNMWYSLEVPHLGTSNEYIQHMLSGRNKKKKYFPDTLSYLEAFFFFHTESISLHSTLIISNSMRPGPKVITFSMLNSSEHEICSANKSQIANNCKFFLSKT